mmetsp:Transcript_119049/g.237385  ORF Transcript_119049/g.237385 Transcript_119049/m.237385 type:complete len:207 (-) Transcript_119049:83-703(-)
MLAAFWWCVICGICHAHVITAVRSSSACQSTRSLCKICPTLFLFGHQATTSTLYRCGRYLGAVNVAAASFNLCASRIICNHASRDCCRLSVAFLGLHIVQAHYRLLRLLNTQQDSKDSMWLVFDQMPQRCLDRLTAPGGLSAPPVLLHEDSRNRTLLELPQKALRPERRTPSLSADRVTNTRERLLGPERQKGPPPNHVTVAVQLE